MKRWRTIDNRAVFDSPVLRLDASLRESPPLGPKEFVVLTCPDWVNVVPITTDGKMVLIRQFRQGAQRVEVEIPGGMVDPGESPDQAAARELREETGYRAVELEFLGKVNPNPALFTNTCHTFLAMGVELDGPLRLDDAEQIEVFLEEPGRVMEMVAQGVITHSLVIAALTFFGFHQAADPAGMFDKL